MSETKKTHDVIVQKDIALATGESLSVYAQKVRDAGKSYIKQKLNLGKDSSCYPVEIFSKSVVFDVYQFGENVEESKRVRFYAAAYTRKNDGSFEFNTLTEVERVVGYQPKEAATAVTKGHAPAQPQAPESPDAPGWLVAKALWNGVL